MKPPVTFHDPKFKLPPKWRVSFSNIIEKLDPEEQRRRGNHEEFPVLCICNNEGKFWDYYNPQVGCWKAFDASGCNTLAEVCALVEVLRRMEA